MDNETKLITLLSEFPIIRRVGEDILIDCDWDLERARKNTQNLFSPHSPNNGEPHYISDDDSEEIPQHIKEKVDMPQKIHNSLIHAKERMKWFLIILFNKDQNYDWVNDENLKRVLLSRYEYMLTSMERPESQFLVTVYDMDASKYPSYIIFDPNDIMHPIQGHVNVNQKEFANVLNEFLFVHSKYGLPVSLPNAETPHTTFSTNNKQNSILPQNPHLSSSSGTESGKESSLEDENSKMKQDETVSSPIDKGEIISIGIQTMDKKKCQIEIGENETVSALYKKIAQLINADENTFSLQTSIPMKELKNKKATIKEENLRNAFLRIIHIAY